MYIGVIANHDYLTLHAPTQCMHGQDKYMYAFPNYTEILCLAYLGLAKIGLWRGAILYILMYFEPVGSYMNGGII